MITTDRRFRWPSRICKKIFKCLENIISSVYRLPRIVKDHQTAIVSQSRSIDTTTFWWLMVEFGGLMLYSKTLPRAGTMQNGRLYLRAEWVPHTHGKDCSSYPTPTACFGQRGWGLTETNSRGYSKETHQRCREIGWRPSPETVEALMGFPIGHTDVEHSGTQ